MLSNISDQIHVTAKEFHSFFAFLDRWRQTENLAGKILFSCKEAGIIETRKCGVVIEMKKFVVLQLLVDKKEYGKISGENKKYLHKQT